MISGGIGIGIVFHLALVGILWSDIMLEDGGCEVV